MARLLCLFVLIAVLLAACGAEPDSAPMADAGTTVAGVQSDTLAVDLVPDTTAALDTVPARVQALNVALDSLEAFVVVLEQIEGPIAAWNRAAEAARLLRYLEQNRAAFALNMPEEEARRRYPDQIRRLNDLEARRTAELERLDKDGVAGRVLVQEMAKADAAARAGGQ